ncbi:hypothetical protein MSC49_36580 [Methylosinus sp. C49]|nr:hypothetical protein MSC49_36580 [Methylosinus sp. C49]
MFGPASRLWANYFPERPLQDDMPTALLGAAALLSGTGWASDIEHLARIEAARLGIHSIGVIDHWANYAARFERNGFRQLPDEIWVADVQAEAIARRTFPQMQVFRRPNLYVREQLSRIGPPPGKERILYVLEPVRNDWGHGTPGEFQALDYALSRLTLFAPASNSILALRPHPSESVEKYQAYADRHPYIRFDHAPDLSAAISDADIVIGVESFALTLALAAGRRVFSTLPPWAPLLRLPHQGIIQIRNLPQEQNFTRGAFARATDEEQVLCRQRPPHRLRAFATACVAACLKPKRA